MLVSFGLSEFWQHYRDMIVHIETIGQYEVVLEAFRNLGDTAWIPFVTIHRGSATAYRSVCVMQRQPVSGVLPSASREQAIDLARSFAARRIARGDL